MAKRNNINFKKLFSWKLVVLLTALVSTPLVMAMVSNRTINFPEAAAQSRLYISPASSSIPEGTTGTFDLIIDSGSYRVAFVEAVVTFDSSRLELASDPVAGSPLTRVIVTTSRGTANANGRVELALALPVEGRDNPATGASTLATLRFRSRTTSTNVNTQIGLADVQVINIEAQEISNETSSATVTLNPTASSSLTITNTSVSNGKTYVWDTFNAGTLTYIDRTLTIPSSATGIPQGARYLRTANDDKNSKSTEWLRFTVNRNVRVYVLHDERTTDPWWLTSTFTRTDILTDVGGGTFRIFERTFPAGEVVLGGNLHGDTAPFSAQSMYVVAVTEN